jgi:hypothetical protein
MLLRNSCSGTHPEKVGIRVMSAPLLYMGPGHCIGAGDIVMKKRSGPSGAEPASIAGDLMLAPMVALMRLPLMATETGRGAAWGTETNGAVSEKLAAVAEGAMAAQLSVMQSALRFWPEIFAGRTPSLLSGVAMERLIMAALKPASKQVRANFKRLSRD